MRSVTLPTNLSCNFTGSERTGDLELMLLFIKAERKERITNV